MAGEGQVFTFILGVFTITTLLETQRQNSCVPGHNSFIDENTITTDIIDETCSDGIAGKVYNTSTSCFLVQFSGHNYLFDAGSGGTSDEVLENLQNLTTPLTPDDIEAVFITHMHSDHVGGLLKGTSPKTAFFPNAKIYINKDEHDDPAYINNEIFSVYTGDKLVLFTPGNDYSNAVKVTGFEKIKAAKAYGHTVGHTVYLLEDGKTKFALVGDTVHAAQVQFPYPDVAMIFDTNEENAIASRKNVFSFLQENKIPAAGCHMPFPAQVCVEGVSKGSYPKYSFSFLDALNSNKSSSNACDNGGFSFFSGQVKKNAVLSLFFTFFFAVVVNML